MEIPEKNKVPVDLIARFLHGEANTDDIIDLESEKIDAILAKVKADPEDEEIKRIERKMWENIRQKTLLGRRTGIGITAEGDMLAALGLRYGSDDATDFSVDIHKTLATEVYGASADLAAERGPFPIYNAEREKNNPFIQRLKEHAHHRSHRKREYLHTNIFGYRTCVYGQLQTQA